MWNYEWVQLSQEVELLVRYRQENRLDKMGKLHSEPLAYILERYHSTAPVKYLDYTAFVHVPDYSTEEPEPLFDTTTDYKALQHEVEEYFRNKPDEEITVPTSAV